MKRSPSNSSRKSLGSAQAPGKKPVNGFVKNLEQSPVYQEFAESFSKATGLPLLLTDPRLRPAEVPLTAETLLCRILTGHREACRCCTEFQWKLTREAGAEPLTLQCPAGLCETAVPLRVGEKTMAFLKTGHVFLAKPQRQTFHQFTRQLSDCAASLDHSQLEQAWLATRVVPPDQYEGSVRLLAMFTRNLANSAANLFHHQNAAEPRVIRLAKQFLDKHFAEHLTLAEVAGSVNLGTHYFCKIFREHTGLSLTEYVSRARVKKACDLLRNSTYRINEIAYRSGFQSLSQFNRVFRRIAGMSPGHWRRAKEA